ncbi:PAS domain-containing protein [Sneathiella marina]|uniref:PAS domain-containing protein n=1 Tax=Sneathiella marina TaxID=2950108 RepID=A0ABY4W400_9PROT|nr:PAS domain-containing protein [Sneathiella marina]USG61918.1 PAS domain-containing protein [Sneathiella marina]
MERIKSGNKISSITLIELRDYWLEKRRSRKFPARADIDPVEFPNLLPQIALVDVTYDPLRFRYRLIGTTITAISERDATGHFIDENLYGERTENMLWAFKTCVHTKTPVAVREQVQFVKKERVVVEVLVLPLGETDDRVDMALVCLEIINSLEKAPAMGTSLTLDWSD